jgi:hypothetical protein
MPAFRSSVQVKTATEAEDQIYPSKPPTTVIFRLIHFEAWRTKMKQIITLVLTVTG